MGWNLESRYFTMDSWSFLVNILLSVLVLALVAGETQGSLQSFIKKRASPEPTGTILEDTEEGRNVKQRNASLVKEATSAYPWL